MRLPDYLLPYISFLLVLNITSLGVSQSSIRVSDQYPQYWAYKGKPTLLLGGTVEDNLFQIPDLETHVDLLKSVGGNYVRNTMSSRDSGNVWAFYFDEKEGVYDLSKWNEGYWNRFENFLKLTAERDIIVQIEVWATFDFYRDNWTVNPFNPKNNRNYTAERTKLPEEVIPQLENPVTLAYLKQHLSKNSPRLVLNKNIEKQLRQKVKTDPVVTNLYKAIQLNAEKIQTEPLLVRKMTGRRLLHVSREMLYRMNMLGMAYRMEKDKTVLKRINEEILAVCQFSDWNPSHFLDVAEMALAVAIGLDWTAGDLPKQTIQTAQGALIEKALLPGFPEEGEHWWSKGDNNWNQVCHGGLIAAAIVVAEKEPELAVKTIRRALEYMPYALKEYGPDGVYPEGSTYWEYGTSFSVITAAMFESAFGTDFGMSEFPAFKESAVFRWLANAPSGMYYNFADCGDRRGPNGDMTLAWFATKTGNPQFFEKERFLRPAADMGQLPRLGGAALVWISQFTPGNVTPMPTAWHGNGPNPIVIFKSDEKDPHQYYLGAKGGHATVSHGNMDAGSFIFELNGVRWVIDPGNQNYNDLEKTGFDLWGKCQECERWTLLTKNNYGHSTLTVDNQLHVVDGKAEILDFKDGDKPEAIIHLTPVFQGQLQNAQRRFVKDSPTSLIVEDKFVATDSTKLITWQLMTTADVEIVSDGAVLRQDGKSLKLENLSHPDMRFSVISLDPAPLELDRQIEGLKRVELRVPVWVLEKGGGVIRIRLVGQ